MAEMGTGVEDSHMQQAHLQTEGAADPSGTGAVMEGMLGDRAAADSTLDDLTYYAQGFARLISAPVRLYRDGTCIWTYSPISLVRDPVTGYEAAVCAFAGDVGYISTDDGSYVAVMTWSDTTLALGPFYIARPGREAIRRLALRLDVPAAEYPHFERGMYAIPPVPIATTIQALCMLYYALSGVRLDASTAVLRGRDAACDTGHRAEPMCGIDGASNATDASTSRAPEAPLPATPLRHNSMEVERTIQNLVRRGKPNELRTYFANIPSFGYGTLSADALRSMKNIFVSTATLVSRAAVAGGLSEESALSLSDTYINRCELISNSAGILELSYEMTIDFAERVARVRLGSEPSALVLGTTNYVQEHLYERITTEDIAQALFVSRSYLSSRFKRETGIALAAYVQTEKVREAKQLLRATSLSLLSISTYLGYSSQSQFGTVFKRACGITPSEYRQQR